MPARNTVVETEFHRYGSCEAVRFVSARAATHAPLEWSSDEQMYRMAQAIQDGEPEALERLVPLRPELVVIGETATFVSLEDFEQRRSAYQRAVGCPVVFWLEAFMAAQRLLGFGNNVAILGPRVPAASEHKGLGVLREWGLTPASIGGLGCTSAREIAVISEEKFCGSVLQMDRSDIDAVFVLATNLPAMRWADQLEARMGKPVLHINAVLLWFALRSLGVNTQLDGCGSLLKRH